MHSEEGSIRATGTVAAQHGTRAEWPVHMVRRAWKGDVSIFAGSAEEREREGGERKRERERGTQIAELKMLI